MNKDKAYKITISVLTMSIFIVMIVLSFTILMGDSKYKLGDISIKEEITQQEDTEIFKQIINFSCSLLEYANVTSGGQSTREYALGEISDKLGIKGLSTKNLIESQMGFLKDYEELVVEETFVENVQSEDQDIHGIYEFEDYKDVYVRNQTSDSDDYVDDIVVLDTQQEQEEVVETQNTTQTDKLFHEFEIISTPVPAPKKFTHNINDPLVFIYHTHGTESYRPESVGNYHSLTRKYTVRRVGDELTKNLEELGLNVIHDDTVHDYPSYQGSYSRSLATLNTSLKKNNSMKIVFDIHRDGIDKVDSLDANSYKMIRDSSVVNINGENVATFSIVLGGGNENIKELKQFAYHLKAVSDKLYPGLSGKIIIKQSNAFKYKLNQYKTDYSALLEIGNNTNTIEEAEATTKYLSKVIAYSVKSFVSVKEN